MQQRNDSAHLEVVLLMLLAVAPVLVSAAISYNTGDGHWFQRSGSLMVLLSVVTEFRRSRLKRAGLLELPRFIPLWRSVPYVCYASIAMGTLIWGYGDLMFAH